MDRPHLLVAVARSEFVRAAVAAMPEGIGDGTPYASDCWVWGLWIPRGDLSLLHRLATVDGLTVYIDREDWMDLAGIPRDTEPPLPDSAPEPPL